MKRFFLQLLLFALFLVPCFAQESELITEPVKLQIIKEILLDADFLNRDLRGEEKKNSVYLSTENMPSNLETIRIKGVKIQFKTSEEIEEVSRFGLRYFVFEDFKVENSRILVSFCDRWIKWGAFLERAFDYEYRKASGKWKRVKPFPPRIVRITMS